MPVTINIADHPAECWRGREPAASTGEFLEWSDYKSYKRTNVVYGSSLNCSPGNGTISAKNGLVHACWHAYSDHHHLVIRPEDVWFAVLSQFSFYINAHAEEYRSMLVSHKGKEKIRVRLSKDPDSDEFGEMALEMTEQMDKFVLDKELRQWIMPKFTTTIDTDRIVAAVIMMGVMQKYFDYECYSSCGIPSVTLLGEKSDWVEIKQRLSKLKDFGPEPEQFAVLLDVVLDNIILTFNAPDSELVRKFWGKMVDDEEGSGFHRLTGWITAFCMWTEDGECLHTATTASRKREIYKEDSMEPSMQGCRIDKQQFHYIEFSKAPTGYVTLPIKYIDPSWNEHHCQMIAGSVGFQLIDHESLRSTLAPDRAVEPTCASKKGARLDTLQPVCGWWMYEGENST